MPEMRAENPQQPGDGLLTWEQLTVDFGIVASAIKGAENVDQNKALLSLASIALYADTLRSRVVILEAEKKTANEQATTDVLTGLPNRRALEAKDTEDALHRQHREEPAEVEQRGSVPAGHWLGFIDLDGFKPVNDKLGHVQGDRALTLFAYALRLATRPEDELYRIGGDEFAVVMGVRRPMEEGFSEELGRRLEASSHFLLTDEGAAYLEMAGFGRPTEVDREVVANLLGWTIGENYVEGSYINRAEALIPADGHMNEQKEAKGAPR